MEFRDVVLGRRSVRAFLNEDVDKETILSILEDAIQAPSAGNIQPWRFILVRSQDVKFQLANASGGQRFVAQAPWVIAIVAECDESAVVYGERGRDLYCIQDTAALAMIMMLAAHDRGLGSCWVGAFDDDEVHRVLGIKPGERVVALIPIGKPARSPGGRSPRKPLSGLVEIIE